jgi:hypothetical protein
MDSITHIAFQSWDAIDNPIFRRSPIKDVPLCFPNLTSLSFDHQALTTVRTIHCLVEYLGCRLGVFGTMPEVVVLTQDPPDEAMKRTFERRLEAAKEHILSRTNERDLEGAEVTIRWELI